MSEFDDLTEGAKLFMGRVASLLSQRMTPLKTAIALGSTLERVERISKLIPVTRDGRQSYFWSARAELLDMHRPVFASEDSILREVSDGSWSRLKELSSRDRDLVLAMTAPEQPWIPHLPPTVQARLQERVILQGAPFMEELLWGATSIRRLRIVEISEEAEARDIFLDSTGGLLRITPWRADL